MMAVLMDLAAKGTPLTISTVADATGMTRGAVELILHPLEERGLVEARWTRNTSGRGKAKIYQLI
jgi:DNA-binding IclR family transcriptional regulator